MSITGTFGSAYLCDMIRWNFPLHAAELPHAIGAAIELLTILAYQPSPIPPRQPYEAEISVPPCYHQPGTHTDWRLQPGT